MTLVDRSWLETCNQCGAVTVPETRAVHQQWHEWLARQFANMFGAAERLDGHLNNTIGRVLDVEKKFQEFQGELEAQAEERWHEAMERSERD